MSIKHLCYPVTQAIVPQLASSSDEYAESKKKSNLHRLKKKKDLISLLKQSLQDDEDYSNNKSNASSKASIANDDNLYYSYDGSLFGQDPIFSSELVEI